MKPHIRTAVITGATSGIGIEISKHLVKQNYQLIVLARNAEKVADLKEILDEVTVGASVISIACNLSSFFSVQNACKQIHNEFGAIDLLVLNAGIWNFELKKTENQIEETLQVNVLSQMLIFNELYAQLANGVDPKVLFTASALHKGKINFDDLELRNNFSGFHAYRQSKLGVILLTKWWASQERYNNLSFYSVHPGMVNTNLGRSAGWFSQAIFKLFGKSPKKGAQTHLHLINTSTKNLNNGAYYANSKVTDTTYYSKQMDNANALVKAYNNYLSKL